MGAYQIDELEFISLSRPLERGMKRIVREVRAGVSGVSFWDTGSRGTPMEFESVVDCVDIEGAIAEFEEYQALVDGFEPVTVKWGNHEYTTQKFMILDVSVIDGGMEKTLLGKGGTLGTSGALLKCRWVAEAVPVSD